MPYLYILFFSRNLPLWVYALVSGVAIFSVVFIVRRLIRHRRMHSFSNSEVSVMKRERITDDADEKRLWDIYRATFEKVNRMSPCRQSFDKEHFLEALHDVTVLKYLLIHKDAGSIGIGFITNDFKNTPWISWEYFKAHYPEPFEQRHIYYFMGLAIDEKFRGRRYSLPLIEHIIDDLPHHAIMGFDHSGNVNPMLHHFTRIVKQARSLRRSYLDRQHYHIVKRM
jgi:ribosomal protein S18 acetylase RimI-like enzyme